MIQDADIAMERQRLGLKRADLLREQAYVAGGWRSGEARLEVQNPSSGRVIAHVPDLSAQDALDAVAAAHAAFPAWSRRTAKARGDLLRRWCDLVLLHAENLARLLTAEQGKPLAEARAEIDYAAAYIDWFAGEGRRAYGQIIPPHASDRRISVTPTPVGVVAAITPWNFPAAMVTRKLAPALAAGCTVVLKPSELTPLTALAFAVLTEEAGLDPGVLNVVTGRPTQIGDVLIADPRVRKLTFTGSTAVGKMLAARCAGTVKRLSLELGGNAPFIVFADADLDAAIDGLLASKFRNAGQTCICANRVLVQADRAREFIERLAERVVVLRMGDGFDPTAQIGPLIHAAAAAKVRQLVADAVVGGAKLIGGAGGKPGFVTPSVLTDVTADMAVASTEVFGPVASIMSFHDDAEAVALANGTGAGLAAYVYTRDLGRACAIPEALDYGMVGLNTGLISSEVIPFGGVKESGYGREGSSYGLGEYLNLKAVCAAI